MSADRIMALADSGTPCPKHRAIGVVEGCGDCDGPYVDGAIVLPKVAALVAAIDALPANRMPKDHDPECDGVYCMHPVVALYDRMTAARDELVAALGVDSE